MNFDLKPLGSQADQRIGVDLQAIRIVYDAVRLEAVMGGATWFDMHVHMQSQEYSKVTVIHVPSLFVVVVMVALGHHRCHHRHVPSPKRRGTAEVSTKGRDG